MRKDKWISWGSFFGTGNLSGAHIAERFLDYNQARKIVHTLEIKNWREWKAFCKSGNKPDDIPVVAS